MIYEDEVTETTESEGEVATEAVEGSEVAEGTSEASEAEAPVEESSEAEAEFRLPDFDFEACGYEGEGIVSSFICPKCETYAEFVIPFKKEKKETNG